MKEKIDKIYEVIANKELSFGCTVINAYDGEEWRVVTDKSAVHKKYGIGQIKGSEAPTCKGHPVMIGDVLDWIALRDDIYFNHSINEILHKWEGKRKPIEEQSEECINYIYNLVKDD